MLNSVRVACLGAAIAALNVLTACSDGSGTSSETATAPTPAPAPAPVVATADVPVTVMDGLISGAIVCLDVNGNGECEAGDIMATSNTNASGNATIAVPVADVGKYPVVVMVPVGAVDADSGPVTTAYTLMAPADQTAVVSPLTTAVQFVVASTGVSTSEAVSTVQAQTGLPNSPLANYVAAGDSTAGNAARILVSSMQSQTNSLASSVGAPDASGTPMTAADIGKAILAQITSLLTAAVAAGADATVADTCAADKTSAACKDAINAVVVDVVKEYGLTSTTLPGAVALDKTPTVAETTPATPTAGFNLDWVNVGDANNWYTRILKWTAEENTPDSNGLTRYQSIRHLMQNGVETIWSYNGDPARTGDMHWNGSAWVGCTLSTINTSTVRDAQGRGSYNYCDNQTRGATQRKTSDISGKSMSSVFTMIQGTRTDGSNWGKAPTWFSGEVTASVGSAVFPTGSSLIQQSDTTNFTAINYDVRDSNVVLVSAADVAAGGDVRTNPSVACNADTPNLAVSTLEVMIERNPGTPCIYGSESFQAGNGNTYESGDRNEGWGRTTTSLGSLGSAPVGIETATGFYTTNTRFRVSFKGGSSNEVTFYRCMQRADFDSTRNCTSIGTGTYTISTLGDARIMTLSGFPIQMAALSYERVFVERGGKIFWGAKSKFSTTTTVRVNGTAGNAILSQLGLATITP